MDTNQQTQFFAVINLASSFFTILGQMFIVRHVVRKFGIGTSLAILPVLSMLFFVWVALEPTLLVIAIADVVRRSTGFTFGKPTTDMLYSVVTPEEKYKTKNFIDTAIYRFGDVIGVWAIRFMMGLGITGVSLVMIPFAAVWALVALWLGRDYRQRARELRVSGVI